MPTPIDIKDISASVSAALDMSDKFDTRQQVRGATIVHNVGRGGTVSLTEAGQRMDGSTDQSSRLDAISSNAKAAGGNANAQLTDAGPLAARLAPATTTALAAGAAALALLGAVAWLKNRKSKRKT